MATLFDKGYRKGMPGRALNPLRLTAKQRLFAELCASGMPQIVAYKRAYPGRPGRSFKAERTDAHKLSRHPGVVAAIGRFQWELVERGAERSHTEMIQAAYLRRDEALATLARMSRGELSPESISSVHVRLRQAEREIQRYERDQERDARSGKAQQLARQLFITAAEDILTAKAAAAAAAEPNTIAPRPHVANLPGPASSVVNRDDSVPPQPPAEPDSRQLSVSDTHTAGGYWFFELIPGRFPPQKRRRWVPAQK